ICRLEYVHSFSYVHRDIKPQNVLTGGPNNPHIIYLVDFSHAKEYRDPRTNAHVPYCQNLAFTGTPNFASINTHLGMEASRR
ncbi:kinase-like domain-containing protein, partial [Hygrophoropsis aurantiaca]